MNQATVSLVKRLAYAALSAAALILQSHLVSAQEKPKAVVADYEKWFAECSNAKPDFKPGDTLTVSDLGRMRCFVPPAYLDQLNFPEFKTKIVEPIPHLPSKAYSECTEKYANQVKLAADGALQNYTCGQPFSNSSLDPKDPNSGVKAGWDFMRLFWGRGFIDLNWDMNYTFFGGPHSSSNMAIPDPVPRDLLVPDLQWSTPFPSESQIAEYHGGGGATVRSTMAFYSRLYLAHLAEFNGGSLPIPGGEDYDYKNLTLFYFPFDVRGTAFIIFRHWDPHLADDAWAYIPALRRVRRISAEEKSDALLGSDITFDDFDGLNDRVLNWDWKFLGFMKIMAIHDPTHYVHWFGPNGNIPDDERSVKTCAVTVRMPRNPRHPYSAVINFWDADDWTVRYMIMFDRAGKLWKVMEWEYKYSETFSPGFWYNENHGAMHSIWWDVSAIDVQNHRSSVLQQYGPIMNGITPQIVQVETDISNLERVHR